MQIPDDVHLQPFSKDIVNVSDTWNFRLVITSEKLTWTVFHTQLLIITV